MFDLHGSRPEQKASALQLLATAVMAMIDFSL
jgi:hypothetical protein